MTAPTFHPPKTPEQARQLREAAAALAELLAEVQAMRAAIVSALQSDERNKQ